MIKNKQLLKKVLIRTLKNEHGVKIKESYTISSNKVCITILLRLLLEICNTSIKSLTTVFNKSFCGNNALRLELALSRSSRVFFKSHSGSRALKKLTQRFKKVLINSKEFFQVLPRVLKRFYCQKFYYYHKCFLQVQKNNLHNKNIYSKFRTFGTYKNFLQQKVKPLSYRLHVTIRYVCNNIFCTFKNLNNNKIIYATSTGREKLKASKKNLRFISKILFSKFFAKIKLTLRTLYQEKQVKLPFKVLITLITPKKSRKVLVFMFQRIFKRNKKISILFHFKENKCFNGCRPRKQQRKKRKGFKRLK